MVTYCQSAHCPQDLPSGFDLIVVGTGITESLVAAAAARVGKRVLNLDANAYYGARNATFSVQSMDRWLRGESELADAAPSMLADPDNKRWTPVTLVADRPEQVSYVTTERPPSELLDQSHRYNLDVMPQLLLSSGSMVDVLRSSGVANYLEFKPLQSCLYHECMPGSLLDSDAVNETANRGAGAWHRVPCGKADIFQSEAIPLIQKRQLMKCVPDQHAAKYHSSLHMRLAAPAHFAIRYHP